MIARWPSIQNDQNDSMTHLPAWLRKAERRVILVPYGCYVTEQSSRCVWTKGDDRQSYRRGVQAWDGRVARQGN